MNSPFVRPQDTSHSNGNFVTATKAGGLYGLDVEGGSEHTDPEQTELGDIGRLDADVPIEMPSAEAHCQSQELPRAAYSRRSRAA